MHSLISYTFNDLDCLHAQQLLHHHQGYCHAHSLSTPIVSRAFLRLSHQVTILLHHDIASQQHGPDSAMPQPTPNAIFGAHLSPLTQSVQTQPALSEATHSPHPSRAIPIPSSQLAPACQPFKSEASSARSYLTRPPHTISALRSGLSTQSSSSRLTPVLPHVSLLRISSILGNERPGLVLKVLFFPPSILHLM